MAGVRLVPLRGARRGRLPPAAARGVEGRPHAAHAARAAVQPEQPDRHRLPAGRGRDRSPASAATTVSSWWPTRSTASSSTTARNGHERPRPPGNRGPRGRRRQPLEALQRLRHPPRLPGDAQPDGVRTPALRMAQGRLSPPGPRPARRAGARPSSGRTTRRAGARSTRRAATCSSTASPRIPGRLPAQARGRLLLRRPAAGRGQRGLRVAGSSPTSPTTARR